MGTFRCTEKYHHPFFFFTFALLLSGLGADPSKPPCKKAKQLRLERKQQRLAQRQEAADTAQNHGKAAMNAGKSKNEPKSLEEFILDAIPGQEPKHRLEVRM